MDLISSGKIDVKWLVTDRYKFEQAGEAFELVRQGKESVIKVIIEGVSSSAEYSHIEDGTIPQMKQHNIRGWSPYHEYS